MQLAVGAGQALDEPEGGAAWVEVGWVGGLGEVIDYLVGGVQQPLGDRLGVVEFAGPGRSQLRLDGA